MSTTMSAVFLRIDAEEVAAKGNPVSSHEQTPRGRPPEDGLYDKEDNMKLSAVSNEVTPGLAPSRPDC